jgi:hypothetical protein
MRRGEAERPHPARGSAICSRGRNCTIGCGRGGGSDLRSRSDPPPRPQPIVQFLPREQIALLQHIRLEAPELGARLLPGARGHTKLVAAAHLEELRGVPALLGADLGQEEAALAAELYEDAVAADLEFFGAGEGFELAQDAQFDVELVELFDLDPALGEAWVGQRRAGHVRKNGHEIVDATDPSHAAAELRSDAEGDEKPESSAQLRQRRSARSFALVHECCHGVKRPCQKSFLRKLAAHRALLHSGVPRPRALHVESSRGRPPRS